MVVRVERETDQPMDTPVKANSLGRFVSVYFAVHQTLGFSELPNGRVDSGIFLAVCGRPTRPEILRPSAHRVHTTRIDKNIARNESTQCAGVTWIPLCARDGSVIKWGRGEGETLSIHVVWTRCALGLNCNVAFTQLQRRVHAV